MSRSKREIEQDYGVAPNTELFNNIELFSLWMMSCSPLPNKIKYRLLSTQDTMDRLEWIVNSFVRKFGEIILQGNKIQLPRYTEDVPSTRNSSSSSSGGGNELTMEDFFQMMPPGLMNAMGAGGFGVAGPGGIRGIQVGQPNMGGFDFMTALMEATEGGQHANRNRRTAPGSAGTPRAATRPRHTPATANAASSTTATTGSSSSTAGTSNSTSSGANSASTSNTTTNHNNGDDDDSMPPLAPESESDESDGSVRGGATNTRTTRTTHRFTHVFTGDDDDDEDEDNDDVCTSLILFHAYLFCTLI